MLEKGCDADFFADTVTSEYYKNLGQVQFSLKKFIPMCDREILTLKEKKFEFLELKKLLIFNRQI